MLKKICNILNTIIMVALLLIAAVLIVPNLMGYKNMAVLSGSMEPGIPVGSVVMVKETDPAGLQPGDIITYRLSENTLVTHRVQSIDTEKQEIITKGDANNTEDANPVTYAQVVGLMKMHLPLLGYISIYIKSPIGIAVICGIVIVLILLNFLPSVFGPDNKEEQKNKKIKKNKDKE